jgi:hypothetical protein
MLSKSKAHRALIAAALSLVAGIAFSLAAYGKGLTTRLVHGDAKANQKRPVPYDVDKRAAPPGSDLTILLPLTVGTFKRQPFPPGAKPPAHEDINTTYTSGKDSVFVGFSIPDSAEDAHAAVETTRTEAVASKISLKGELYSVGTEPSYFKLPKFMSWSRGKYFFYADASSPEALDRFMRAFPY